MIPLPVPAMPAETQRRLDAAGRDLLLDALWQIPCACAVPCPEPHEEAQWRSAAEAIRALAIADGR